MNPKRQEWCQSIDKDTLWRKFVHGDFSCYENIFRAYYKPMYGYGVKLCQQPELVKDSIQTLFRTVWERREELSHIKSPNVYLFVSLRRSILRKVKAQRSRQGDREEAGEEPRIQFGQEELIIRNEVKIQQKYELQQALNQLSNRQKEVIYLHFYNGMSYGEIEQILSINRQSVRNHMYRAMETLRTILDPDIMRLVV